jgi:hypothetical protein
VYFTYFGLTKNDLTKVRQALSKSNRYQSLYSDDHALFRFKPDDLFLTAEDTHIFGVAVVDTDEQASVNLVQYLKKDMDRLHIITDSSYQMFLHKYFEAAGSPADRTPPKPTEDADFYKVPLELNVAAEGLRCVKVSPAPAAGDLLLGHPAVDLFSNPEKWLSLITDKGSRLVLEETLQLVARGREMSKVLILNDAQNTRRAVKFTMKNGDDNLVTILLQPAGLTEIVEKQEVDNQNKELEALILDVNFVPEDPVAWVEGLRTRAKQIGLTKEGQQLKFFVAADSDARASGPLLDSPDILGFLLKPVDQRQILFLLSEYLPNKNTIYQFENIGWAQPNLSIHVSKGVHLEALSEFGVTMRSKQPLAPGTMVYLRKSIYDNAPNACLAARVYSCEEHPSEKDHFQVFATYFGINDAFLKFARTWIRENYAQQKGKEGG